MKTLLKVDEGILLEKKPLREYDEQLLFLTKQRGKVTAMGYGTKSSKSKRRAALSSGAWLQLSFSQRKEQLLLTRVAVHREIFSAEVWEKSSVQDYLFFYSFLKQTARSLPYKKSETLFFSLFKLFTHPQLLTLELGLKQILFPLGFLKTLGCLPEQVQCEICLARCSPTYCFTDKMEFLGSGCLKKHQAASVIIKRGILLSKETLALLEGLSKHFILKEHLEPAAASKLLTPLWPLLRCSLMPHHQPLRPLLRMMMKHL